MSRHDDSNFESHDVKNNGFEANGFEDLGFSKVDYAREARNGQPEVIYGEGKRAEHIVAIAARLIERHGRTLITRLDADKADEVMAALPGGRFDAETRLLAYGQPQRRYGGHIAVVCAGTSDLPVAEEAAQSAEWLGCRVERIYDVGVAGLDRLLAFRERLTAASVTLVVAGMEGALPSVVAGLVRNPVIAVPTSIGYGANLHGITALLGMLSSCASGMSVVNVDNGFGAAYQASAIMQLVDAGHPDAHQGEASRS